jgi:hypothetical protein
VKHRAKISAIIVGAFASLHPLTPALATDHDKPDWVVTCGGTYNLCGYFEREGRRERIPPKFERAFDFSEGLAGVRVDGRYGYITTSGKIAIQPQFDLVGEFRNGHAEVLLGDKAGIIDTAGNFLLQPQYARAIPFGRTAALVLPGRWVSPYMMGAERLDTDAFHSTKERFALIDLASGKTLTDELYITEFDYKTYVWASRMGGPGLGLLAPDGSWKIKPTYMEAQRMFQGRSIVCKYVPADRRGDAKYAHCGSVDENGEVALPLQPTYVNGYWNGLYRIFRNQKPGLLTEAGVLLAGQVFDDISPKETGDVIEVQKDGKWVGLTRSGEIVANPNDGKVLLTCPSGVKFVSKSHGMEVIGPDGTATEPYVFGDTFLGRSCDFPMTVGYDGKYGFLSSEGKLILDPPFFENGYSFLNGFAGVKKDGKWGIVDERGNFTVAPKYDELRPDAGLYAVKSDHQSFWIEAHGEQQPEPYRAEDRRETLQCGNGGGTIIGKEVNGQTLWGLADADGKTIIEPRYRAISCFENGLAWVPVDEKKAWCAIDRYQRVRENVQCVTNWIANRVFDAGPEKMSDDYYESGVLWMRANLEYGLGLRKKPPRIVGHGITRTF